MNGALTGSGIRRFAGNIPLFSVRSPALVSYIISIKDKSKICVKAAETIAGTNTMKSPKLADLSLANRSLYRK